MLQEEAVRRELQEESQAKESWRRRNAIEIKVEREIWSQISEDLKYHFQRSSFDQPNMRNICQYECEICEDRHYHSKPIFTVRESQGDYQFVNPFPLEMKEVNLILQRDQILLNIV